MRLQGALIGFRPWTPEEDAVLREVYAAGGIYAAKKRLRRRTEGSIYHRAKQLGIKRRRRWTASDDKQLRDLWDCGFRLSVIAERLGRSEVTTYWRAQKIGLKLGCPEGFEYLTHAAKRAGYTTDQLYKILRWAKVRVQMSVTRDRGRTRHFHFVDPVEVDDAVAEWNQTETVEAASRRLGVNSEKLWRWLKAAGIEADGREPHEHLRLFPEHVERAIDVGRNSMTAISVRQAAKTFGITGQTLASCLRRAGVKRNAGRVWFVEIEDARAAYAAHYGGAHPDRVRKGLAIKTAKRVAFEDAA